MDRKSHQHSHRRWRLLLLLLVLIPFAPEIMIGGAAGLARLGGCEAGQKAICLVGPVAVSDIITAALQAGAGAVVAAVRSSYLGLIAIYAAIAVWLVLCYVALWQGWRRKPARLLLGFVIALLFAVLPYFGPLLAIANLANEGCRPNDGGVGSCLIFGGPIGSPGASPAHDAVSLGWMAPYGAMLALGIYILYAVIVIVRASPRRPVTPV
jgi:hypothetical protein